MMPLFLFIFHIFITYIHTFIQYIYPSPFAEASLHFFIASMLSGKHLPVVPSRESNSGLPYSKPTRYQLSHAAPSTEPRRTPTEPRRTSTEPRRTPTEPRRTPTEPRRTKTEPRRTKLSHAAPQLSHAAPRTEPRRTKD
jgi:hypothetical protein